MNEEQRLAAWRAHMEMCMRIILEPIGNPEAQVTIICRAPDVEPHEAMISTNASEWMHEARAALDYFIEQRKN